MFSFEFFVVQINNTVVHDEGEKGPANMCKWQLKKVTKRCIALKFIMDV